MKYSPLIYGLISGIIFSIVVLGLFSCYRKKNGTLFRRKISKLDEYEDL